MLKRNFRDRHTEPWCLDEPLGLPVDMQAPWAGTEGEVKVSLLAFPVYGGVGLMKYAACFLFPCSGRIWQILVLHFVKWLEEFTMSHLSLAISWG